MKALKPVLMSILMVAMVSTASPVYAAENIVFHMSFYVHNWRASLEFDDGTDEAPDAELIEEIIVDDGASTEEKRTESELAEESADDLIIDAATEEMISEHAEESTGDSIIVDDDAGTEEITSGQAGESAEASDSEQILTVDIEGITSDPEVGEITIITTEENIQETEVELQGEIDNNDEESSMAREE